MITPPVTLAVTVVGHDRPGIIATVAGALADAAMNLEDSSMTLLRGHFAMTLVCSGTADAESISTALAPLTADGLSVTVAEVAPEPEQPSPGPSYLVTVHGADRLGIVAAITEVVAAAGGNITDLTTRVSGELYVLVAEVDLPGGPSGAGGLTEQLTAAGHELGVGVTVRPVERDEL